MPSFSDIVLVHLIPAAGVITSNLMAMAAVQDVQRAVERGDLGDLNPVPWAVLLGSRIGWVAYNLAYGDLYQFLSNAPGLFVSVWLNLAAVKIQYAVRRTQHTKIRLLEQLAPTLIHASTRKLLVEQGLEPHHDHRDSVSNPSRTESLSDVDDELGQGSCCSVGDGPDNGDDSSQASSETLPQESKEATDALTSFSLLEQVRQIVRDFSLEAIHSGGGAQKVPHEDLVLWVFTLWCVILSVLIMTPSLTHAQVLFWLGLAVNVNTALFHAAPLSTMIQVVRTRSSESIHWPTLLANLSNALLWTVYGVAIQDPFVYIPNLCAIVFAAIQFALKLIYPPLNGEEEEIIVLTH